MATHNTMSPSISAMTSTFSGPQCVAILHYFSCSCRSPHPIYFCRDSKCRHEQPQLHISALPFACSSKQVENNRFWHYANKTRANRSSACSAEDPALSAFAREEDTAPALGDGEILVLDPLEGLCGDNLGQVVPPYAEDWREKVVAKYEDFRDELVGASKGLGVIGEKRLVRLSVEKLEVKEMAQDAHAAERVEEAQAPVETSDMDIPTPDEAVFDAPVAENGSKISQTSSPEPTPIGTPAEITSRLSLEVCNESTLCASETLQAEESSSRKYSPIIDDDDDDVVGFLLDDEDDYYFKPKVAPPSAHRGILGRMLSGLWGSGQ